MHANILQHICGSFFIKLVMHYKVGLWFSILVLKWSECRECEPRGLEKEAELVDVFRHSYHTHISFEMQDQES